MSLTISKEFVIGTYYEKIINLHFFTKYEDTVEAQSLITSERGFKPSISISGSILPNALFTHLEIRIVNGNINFDIYNFEKISIDAGYFNSLMVKGLNGRITQAYVETPGPDGITVFIVLMGEEKFMSEMFKSTDSENPNAYTFLSGLTIKKIIQDFLSQCSNPINGLQNYDLNISEELGSKIYGENNGNYISSYGSMADILQDLINVKFGLNYSIKNNAISVFSKGLGSATKAIEINRFSSTPSIRVSGHINFQAPWVPTLMPGDYIYINPEFMRLTFGGYATTVGANVKAPNVYNVLKIDFDFSTVENTNLMIVDGLASTEEAFSVSGGVA